MLPSEIVFLCKIFICENNFLLVANITPPGSCCRPWEVNPAIERWSARFDSLFAPVWPVSYWGKITAPERARPGRKLHSSTFWRSIWPLHENGVGNAPWAETHIWFHVFCTTTSVWRWTLHFRAFDAAAATSAFRNVCLSRRVVLALT